METIDATELGGFETPMAKQMEGFREIALSKSSQASHHLREETSCGENFGCSAVVVHNFIGAH